MWLVIFCLVFCLISAGCLDINKTVNNSFEESMKLFSTEFNQGESIPVKYTCDGENINPPLSIVDVSEKTVSLVLIMDDPDVPKTVREDGMWVHWVVFNIPPNTREIVEGQNPTGVMGANTRGDLKYGGPCPPDREHRYFFKLYALNKILELSEGATKAEVEKAMQGHDIDQTELMGRYERGDG